MQTTTSPVIKEVLLQAPVAKVWKAITDKDEMKQWYFDLAEFKPEVGFQFRFYGGTEERQYLHICTITEVIELKKLSHTWTYEGFSGESIVTFELFEEDNATRLRLTHSGLETLASQHADMAIENFDAGWEHIIKISLKEFVEKSNNN